MSYLAEEYLKEENAQVPVDILSVDNGRITQPATPDRQPSGYIEVLYRRDKYDQDGPYLVKFQFVKDGGAAPEDPNGTEHYTPAAKWRLHEALAGHQLAEAHPPRLPESDSHAHIVYLAAQRLEKEVNAEYPNVQIKKFTHQITTFEVKDVAKINVRYRLEGEHFAHVPQETPVTTTAEGEPDANAATTEYDFDTSAAPGKDFSRNFALKLRDDDKGWEITQELSGTQDINPKTGAIEGKVSVAPEAKTETPAAAKPSAEKPKPKAATVKTPKANTKTP